MTSKWEEREKGKKMLEQKKKKKINNVILVPRKGGKIGRATISVVSRRAIHRKFSLPRLERGINRVCGRSWQDPVIHDLTYYYSVVARRGAV